MNIIRVNQKYWKLFKNVDVSTSYLSIYLASCVNGDNCVSIDVDEIAKALKISRLELKAAVKALMRLSIIYPYEQGQYLVNPYYIWNGQLLSSEHNDKCKYWNELIYNNPQNIEFCKKSPKSVSSDSFMNVSETLEILASTIMTNSPAEG